MFASITRRLRRIVRKPRADGDLQAATPDTTPAPGIPPDDRRCPNGCDDRTELVSQHELLESEDEAEWLLGNTMKRRDVELISRCKTCKTPVDEIPA